MLPYEITWQWIASQVFALFALGAIVVAYQLKKKSHTLVAVMSFNSAMAISSIMLSNWILVGIYSIGFFRDGVFLWREKYFPNNQKLSISVITMFMILSMAVGAWTFGWWFDVFLIMASMFVDFGSWMKGVHLIRISRLTWCTLVLVNHIRFYNYLAIVIELFIITSIMVFYWKFFRRPKASDNETQVISDNHIQNICPSG